MISKAFNELIKFFSANFDAPQVVIALDERWRVVVGENAAGLIAWLYDTQEGVINDRAPGLSVGAVVAQVLEWQSEIK